MGIRNFLVEGLSGTGKTSVCDELQRRGYQAIHGDRELAYQGDPETGEPTDGGGHEHHIWRVDRVEALVANQDEPVTFFCGGSRNLAKFIHLFDGVFVLEVDLETLNRRLDERPDSDWGGGKPVEREFIERLHRTREDIPKNGISIDATAPIAHVVDEIISHVDDEVARPIMPWPFTDDVFPAELGAVVMNNVLTGRAPVLQVVHFEDGYWGITDGHHVPRERNLTATHLRHVLEMDDSLRELATLPPGHQADREAPGQPWVIGPFEPARDLTLLDRIRRFVEILRFG